ncbi:MAG: Crp/Fnr family transcriptional regulator [Sphingomonadaceae bacterium]|nr:Crp/Fnr family transcriptional regulator [Sphingomonadaceae bacterium]
MSNAFVDKIRSYVPLQADDAEVLEAACANVRAIPARYDLIREGDKPGPVFVMLDGWACRYKLLPEGGRQIVAFLMPGDFCDMHVAVLDEMDHSIATLTPARVAMIPREEMERLIEARPKLTHAFWRTQLVDESVLRAWIVSMGRRSAIERVAHLMCELFARARNIGLVENDRCDLPLTQIVIADALGLTPVHVNRVLRKLREAGAMDDETGKLVITNPAQLAFVAGFDDNYLHRRSRRVA